MRRDGEGAGQRLRACDWTRVINGSRNRLGHTCWYGIAYRGQMLNDTGNSNNSPLVLLAGFHLSHHHGRDLAQRCVGHSYVKSS